MDEKVYVLKELTNKFECQRCGYVWIPKDIYEEPELCPSCRTSYWRVPVGILPKGRPKKVSDSKNV